MSLLKTPRVFISYSWDGDDHRRWVREFATRLRTEGGVDVTLDQWHAVPGDQLPLFMETAVRESDYVLLVCTPKYKGRSDGRYGGPGYEGDIITGEVLSKSNHRKFIPILRYNSWAKAAPSWVVGKYYIDLSGTPYSESTYRELLATLHGAREPAPPIRGGLSPIERTERQDIRAAVIIDEAHGQGRWRHLPPTAELGYKMAAKVLESYGTVQHQKEGPLTASILGGCTLLIMPMPFGTMVDRTEYECITHWVNQGGRLLICGFYFMEAHLFTNFSSLGRLLQIEFGCNLIMPQGRTTREDALAQAFPIRPELCAFTEVKGSRAEHPILAGVVRLAIQSSCTVRAICQEGDCELEVQTGSGIGTMAPKTGEPSNSIPEKFDIVYTYDVHDSRPATFLVATKNGNGRVVAGGSWRMFIDDYMKDDSVDNARLFRNCVDWLFTL